MVLDTGTVRASLFFVFFLIQDFYRYTCIHYMYIDTIPPPQQHCRPHLLLSATLSINGECELLRPVPPASVLRTTYYLLVPLPLISLTLFDKCARISLYTTPTTINPKTM